MDGLDVSAGKAVLRAAGFDVFDILERPPGDADLERVLALLAGYDRVGADWFDRLPALRVVATHSAGVDMVDLAEARRHGITVAPLTGAATREVAAHALAMALALIDQTRAAIDSTALRRMPPGSIVVNVARGELVDEHAMAEALRSGRLAGAACDVLTEEPPRPDHPYLQDERVLMSPHAAFLSPSSLRVYAEQPAHTVVALLAGRDVPHIVEGDW
jgi:D-3-phosphoglycerate dehydrogenase